MGRFVVWTNSWCRYGTRAELRPTTLPTFTEDYLETGLEKASGGDKTRPIVIYCLTSCWMSWNAAKRAMTYGYSQIIWFPDGTDGWQDAGFPLEVRLPEAR